MKVLLGILTFIVNPFSILLKAEVKGREIIKYKWIYLTVAFILSVAISSLIVYLTHKFVLNK